MRATLLAIDATCTSRPGAALAQRLTASPALLAAAVWFGAVWFYFGAIGKTRDDWTWTLIDPATGRAAWGDLFDLPLFWRPLSLVLCRALNTALWEVDWLANTIGAAAHGLVAWSIWRVGRALGAGPRAAVLGAFAFLGFPLTFDVALWTTALPTMLATALLLAVAGLVVRWRAERLTIARALGLFALAATIPCFNEQPAAALPGAIILAWLLGGPRDPHDGPADAGARLRRAIIIGACLLAPQIIYLALFRATSHPTFRGGSGTATAVADLGARALYAADGIWQWTLGARGRALHADAFLHGARNLVRPQGAVWAAAVILGLFAWIRWRPSAAAGARPALPWAGVAFGLAGAACSWLPVVLVNTVWVEGRLFYPGAALVALACACAATAVADGLSFPRACRAGAQALAIGAILAGVVGMIGLQTLQRTRDRFDRDEIAQLARLAPDPPPGAIFLAMRVQRSATGGLRGLAPVEFGAWSFEHIGTAQIRFAIGRRDLYTNRTNRGTPVELTPDGLIIAPWERPAWAGPNEPRQLVGWDRIFPFVIEADGLVRPVRRLRLRQPSGEVITIEPAPTAGFIDGASVGHP